MRYSTTLEKDNINAIAIGAFDGIHRGHQELVKRVGKKGALLIIDKYNANITPEKQRCKYVKIPCFFFEFEMIKSLSGEEFARLLKQEFKNLKKIVVGYDFRFGKKRASKAEELKNFIDVEVEIVKEVKYKDISVHSGIIRDFLREGEIRKANEFLNRRYAISGNIIKGQGLGKKELVPTLNIECEKFILPKEGVYASVAKIGENEHDSVTFIGKRLSADGSFAVETHITQKELPSSLEDEESMEVFFIEKIRENRKFDSLEELKRQIEEDIGKRVIRKVKS